MFQLGQQVVLVAIFTVTEAGETMFFSKLFF